MSQTLSQKASQEITISTDCEMSKFPPTVLTPIADFFKMLSEVSRLQIVCSLKSGPKTVTQIIEITGLGQANVSKHLKLLTQGRIVTRSQQGINVVYEIANPLVFPMCDLVCNALENQLEQQNIQLESLKIFQKYL
jgi:DNA-binding transcriptional ArsR family regulator